MKRKTFLTLDTHFFETKVFVMNY